MDRERRSQPANSFAVSNALSGSVVGSNGGGSGTERFRRNATNVCGFVHCPLPLVCGSKGRKPMRAISSQVSGGMNKRRPMRTTDNRCRRNSLRSSDFEIVRRAHASFTVNRPRQRSLFDAEHLSPPTVAEGCDFRVGVGSSIRSVIPPFRCGFCPTTAPYPEEYLRSTSEIPQNTSETTGDREANIFQRLSARYATLPAVSLIICVT